MTLPGLRADVARASSDPMARWSLAVAPLVARSLLTGGPVPVPGEAPPDEADVRSARASYGRFPGSFVLGGGAFERTVTAAVADDAALSALAGAVLGAGLLAVERERRRDLLEALPESLRLSSRRALEVERSRGGLSADGRMAASSAWDETGVGAGIRETACAALARVFGDVWLDELRVLARGARVGWRLPVELYPGRDELAGWWVRRAW